MELHLVLHAVVLPAFAAAFPWALACVAIRRASGSPGPSRARLLADRLLAVLVVVPALASLARQQGSLVPFGAWPPRVASEWLPWSIVAAALVAAAAGARGGHVLAVACSAVASAVSMVLVAPPGMSGGGSQLVAAAACTLACACASRPAVRTGIAPHAAWWLMAAAGSAMVLLSGFAKLAFVLGALSAGMAAIGAASLLLGGTALGAAASASICCAFSLCMFVGHGYDEAGFPGWCWWLPVVAPAAMALGELRPLGTRPRLRAAVVVLVPAALAWAAVLAAAVMTEGHRTGTAPDDAYVTSARP